MESKYTLIAAFDRGRKLVEENKKLKEIIEKMPHAPDCAMILARISGLSTECTCFKSEIKNEAG